MAAFNSTAIRSNRPLTDDEIRRVAPSIFASAAHESRSERYTYIPTADVLSGLRKAGFEPVAAQQSRCRADDKRSYTKHLLRLRHADTMHNLAVGDDVNEIVLINSHDGTSSYQMMAGVFRLVCTNGLVTGQRTLNDIRVPHRGDVAGRVIEGAYEILNSFGRVDASKDAMKSIVLSPAERSVFARAALQLRWDSDAAPVASDSLLQPRRWADRNKPNADLWTVFNNVQENMIRGGLRGRTAAGQRTTTRAVTGLDADTKINRALWTLAEEMAKIKAAA